MPRVLVMGGTGLAGRAVTVEALARGHEVVVASRRVPNEDAAEYVPGVQYRSADVVTGDGLEEALERADVFIDATNGMGRDASHVLAFGSQNLLHTAARFGVHRAVLLSIANVDLSAYKYYRAKTAQENNYIASPLETRILRTTQFHDFVTSFFRRGARFGLIPAPAKISLQPIAVSDVARLLVDAAEGRGEADTRTVGGPRIETSRALAEQWKSATGARGAIVATRLPGAIGASWRAGENLVPENAIDGLGYSEWLSSTVA
ncbi:SDR family oxidoreductase [Leifsonia sp. NPDC058292]|uniref:SDR family oxidoreductase n=1 Tax=Leifsonia sp. NPDC058292 TaxID=3346428 RepID=UPI0036D874CD